MQAGETQAGETQAGKMQAGEMQAGEMQAAAHTPCSVAGSGPGPWHCSGLLRKNLLRYEENKCVHSHAAIRWGTRARNVSVGSNFVVCRDTYSLGIASV